MNYYSGSGAEALVKALDQGHFPLPKLPGAFLFQVIQPGRQTKDTGEVKCTGFESMWKALGMNKAA